MMLTLVAYDVSADLTITCVCVSYGCHGDSGTDVRCKDPVISLRLQFSFSIVKTVVGILSSSSLS